MASTSNAPAQVWGLITWLYRAVIVGFSGWYTYHSLSVFHDWNFVSNFVFLMQVTAAVVFVYYLVWIVRALLTGVTRAPSESGEVRGFVVMLALMVGLIFNTMLGPVETWTSMVSHIIVPIMVVADWLLFGRGQGNVRAWVPLLWVLLLVPYLIFYWWFTSQPGNLVPYPFIDPAKPDFFMWVGIMIIAFIVGAYLVYGLGKLVGRVCGRRR